MLQPVLNCLPSHKPFKLDKQDILGTVGEIRKNTEVTFFYGHLHIDLPVLTSKD